MLRTLWNRYTAHRARLWAEFYDIVGDLLQAEPVRRLDDCMQHLKFTRLRHSVDVAWRSFLVARLLRLDRRAVARAGLLHDLFFLREDQHSASLLFSHPRVALENARDLCALTPMEEDIILKHMFLLTPCLPRYRESYVVTLVDKYCAAREFVVSPFVREPVCRARILQPSRVPNATNL